MALITITSRGTLGDHFPLLALGRGLVARGHQVRYAGPGFLQSRIEECGMEFRRARPEMTPAMVKDRPDRFDHWKEERGGRAAVEPDLADEEEEERAEMEEQFADVLEASQGADTLICSRLQPVGRMVGDFMRLPWITVCVTPYFYPAAGSSAAKGIAARDSIEDRSPAVRRFYDRLHAMRSRLGLDPAPQGSEAKLFESSRVLLASSPLFGTPPVMPDRDLVQTGFLFHNPDRWTGWRPSDELSCAMAQQPRPLVLAFSSQPVRHPEAVLDAHLLAARKLGRMIIAQSGWAELESPAFRQACERGEAMLIPEGPQDWLFSQAGAVITHGGIGTVARALRAGAPLLVEPFGNDQFYNARQVVALGVGAAANPHRLSADGLAQVLQTKVLAAATREKVLSLIPELDSRDAVEQSCLQVERWLVESWQANAPG